MEPDCAWLTIKSPEAEYIDIPQGEVAGIVEQFEAIREDVDPSKPLCAWWKRFVVRADEKLTAFLICHPIS